MSRFQSKLLVLLAITLAAVDTASKYFMNQLDTKPRLIPGVFEFTHHQNFGLVANIGVPRMLILTFTLVLIAVMFFLLVAKPERLSWAQGIGLSFIIGGALGNFFDRLVHGFVYDWILLFNTSIINSADIFIGLGIGILLIDNFQSKDEKTIDTRKENA